MRAGRTGGEAVVKIPESIADSTGEVGIIFSRGAARASGCERQWEGTHTLKSTLSLLSVTAAFLAFTSSFAARQSSPSPEPAAQGSAHKGKEQKPTAPGKEIGRGGEDVGKGVGKGSVDLGKGAAGSVGNLATGHPISAGASLGKGTAGFGKHAGVGTGKGAVKIGKGVGGEFKKAGRKIGGKNNKQD